MTKEQSRSYVEVHHKQEPHVRKLPKTPPKRVIITKVTSLDEIEDKFTNARRQFIPLARIFL